MLGENQGPRLMYKQTDFIDYLIMNGLTLALVAVTFGWSHPFSIATVFMLLFMTVMFPIRHGATLSVPILFKSPKSLFFTFYNRLNNVNAPYIIGISLFAVEIIAVVLTPQLPHKVEFMRDAGIILIYVHFGLISLFRSIVLVAHLRKTRHVRQVLMDSPWKQFVSKSTVAELFHSYFTGLITHITMLVPFYLVTTCFLRSILFVPLNMVLIRLLGFREKFFTRQNRWQYRDHWLAHNSPVEFVYLHGPHHDAIPTALLAVGDHGYLEGALKHSFGWPVAFLNAIDSFLLNTLAIWIDMKGHQFVPGIFPYSRRKDGKERHHSVHHYLSLVPYSLGLRLKGGLPNPEFGDGSIDEVLDNYDPRNKRITWFLGQIEKYEGPRQSGESS